MLCIHELTYNLLFFQQKVVVTYLRRGENGHLNNGRDSVKVKDEPDFSLGDDLISNNIDLKNDEVDLSCEERLQDMSDDKLESNMNFTCEEDSNSGPYHSPEDGSQSNKLPSSYTSPRYALFNIMFEVL